MKKLLYISLLLSSLNANEYSDDIKISLGAYITGSFNSELAYKDSVNGLSAAIDFQELFNMNTDVASFYIDGYYRFSPNHRIEVGWKKNSSKGKSNVTTTVFEGTFLETSIYAGAKSNFNISTLKLIYTYSFYHTKKVEVSLSAGLHYEIFDVGIGANINNLGGDFKLKMGQALPVIGTRLEYHIMPQWSVLYSYDIFSLSGNFQLEQNDENSVPPYLLEHFTGFAGYLSDLNLGTEYRIIDNLSVGATFNYNFMDFSLKLDDQDNFGVKNKTIGFVLYGAAHF